MEDIKISENRYISLINHENDAVRLFETCVLMYEKEYFNLHPKQLTFFDSRKPLADFVNKRLKENGIYFSEVKDEQVWANGSHLMYWSYHNSKLIHGK